MRVKSVVIVLLFCFSAQLSAQKKDPKPPVLVNQVATVWSVEKANAWYNQHKWITGANFLPSTAINQLEMWQSETFDPTTIDKELGWAENIGFNTMRVFLHSLAWKQDANGFKKRINEFFRPRKAQLL